MSENQETIEIYNNIDDKLYEEWESLYKLGAGYNLSPAWCRAWLKYFGKPENTKIIAIWEHNELKLLAPFYIRKNRLVLIGTKPDLYDEFNILYREKKYIDKLIKYILGKGFQLNFRHLDSESEFSKELVKYISGNSVNQHSHVDETKLFVKDEFTPPGSFRTDVRRCRRNLLKDKNEEYVFEFRAEKSDALVNDFIKLHTQRWGGGLLENNSAITDFLREILKDDLTVLSRLYMKNSGETAAICVGYLDSNSKYTYSMTTYNRAYNKYSPGKVFINDLINAVFENGIKYFDMGRGSEAYKGWVANGQSILFSINTNNNPKYYKVQRFVWKILDLVFK